MACWGKVKGHRSDYLEGVPDTSSHVSLDHLLEKSKSFNDTTCEFKSTSSLCKTLLEENQNLRQEIEDNINSAYPLLHEKVIGLIGDFLTFKKKYGSSKEKMLYADMNVVGFVDRMLLKRPMVFINSSDTYLLRNGQKGDGGFSKIGTESEVPPLILEDYMSYDEMKISALLSTSSTSFFINKGNRHNKGVVEEDGTYERYGVIMGVVGARFHVEEKMEWQEMVVTNDQNIKSNGYGPDGNKSQPPRIWADFYESPLPVYKTVEKQVEKYGRESGFVQVTNGYFNSSIYKKRIQVSLETLLLEAHHRAAVAGKKAYVHVVGLGLGVWKFIRHGTKQAELFMEAFRDCLQVLGAAVKNITDVHFSWFDVDACGDTSDGQVVPGTNIMLHFSKRCPQERLTGEHAGKLSVSCWAWDSNCIPGNEYWLGTLNGSGDPAAASNSQIVELHNPYINPKMSGRNLHVATRKHGVLTLQQYCSLANNT